MPTVLGQAPHFAPGDGTTTNPAPGEMPRGSLTVVGTGIQAAAHLTTQTRLVIGRADEVLYLVNDPVAAVWIEGANPNARSLDYLYESGKDRRETYAAIAEEIAARVRLGLDVCAIFYGHPGVFAWPGHEAIRRLRAEETSSRMLPGVSTLDCLVADIGIDPASTGCQTYEATDFLVRRRTIDLCALLILWQIGFVGPRRPTSRFPAWTVCRCFWSASWRSIRKTTRRSFTRLPRIPSPSRSFNTLRCPRCSRPSSPRSQRWCYGRGTGLRSMSECRRVRSLRR